MTLTEFLLARIAEDEAVVGDVGPDWRPLYGDSANGLDSTHDGLMVHPARVLAECEAKRRIVRMEIPEVSRLLALSHADHPDWREEWKP